MAETTEQPDYLSPRGKHLEMVQRVIAKMANGPSAMKCYCRVVIGAAVGVAKP